MRSLHRLLTAVVVLLLLPIPPVFSAEEDPDPDPGAAQKDADEESLGIEKEPKEKKGKGARFMMRKHPSFRVGKVLRVDFRVKFQHDFRVYDPEITTKDVDDVPNLKKMQVAVEGTFLKHFEYEVSREIRNEVADLFKLRTHETKALWRDVYGNFRYFKPFQIKAGQFKMPFGMDQTNPGWKRDFVQRSLIGERLAPGRAIGILAHGWILDRGLHYEAGLFKTDGWKSHLKDGTVPGHRTFAARLEGKPLRLVPASRIFKDVELGAAFTETAVSEGLNGLRGRTWVDTYNWFLQPGVRGHRLRLGTQLSWMPGPFSVKGEFMHARDQRLGQSVRGEDLPDVIGRGWYLSGTWAVTGEKKAETLIPRRAFGWGRGIGAIELAIRDEMLRFGSSEHPGLPSRSVRAANILGNSERIWTFGVNWYLNRFMKIQFNGIREKLEDPQRTVLPGFNTYWTKFVRVQFML